MPNINSTTPEQVIQVGQDTIVCSFSGVGSGLITTDLVQLAKGAGHGVSQASGNLLITTGTGTNDEFLARSTRSWNNAWIKRVKLTASQRIVNQNLGVIAADLIAENAPIVVNSATSVTVTIPNHPFTSLNVGQFLFIGGVVGVTGAVPGRYAIASVTPNTVSFTVAGWPASGSGTATFFGWNHIKFLVNGTTATSALWDAQRNGWASGDTTLTTLTTASPGLIVQTNYESRNVTVADSLSASSTAPAVVTRGSRMENIPDDTTPLYLFLWSYNGTVAPASTTTWTIGFFSVENFENNSVYIAGSKYLGGANPIPIAQVGTNVLGAGTNLIGDVGVQVRATAGGMATVNRLLSAAATTNSTSVKGSAGRVYMIKGYNAKAAPVYLKLYNKATAPTVGTDTPVLTFTLPASSNFDIDFKSVGFYFATGIGFGITGAVADADTTALVAADVTGMNVIYA